MKKQDLFNLKDFLKRFEEMFFVERSFTYFIFKNLSVVEKEIEVVEKIKQSIMEKNSRFFELEGIRNQLLQKYSRKDGNGNPLTERISENTFNVVLEDVEGFRNDFSEIEQEYMTLKSNFDKDTFEYEQLLQSDFDKIEVFAKIKEVDIPRSIALSPKDYSLLDSLIIR